MKAIILAGGLGTRLKSVVPDLPKPLAPIHQRPFLEYLLDHWVDHGVGEFYLSVCYLAQKIKSHFQNSYRGCKIHYIQEPAPLGTGGAILYSLSQFEDQKSDVVILNGDTFVEVNFDAMLAFHKKSGSNLSIALRNVECNDRYSGVELDKNNKITQFCQRKEGSETLLINAGIYLLKPELLSSYQWKCGERFSIEDDFFPEVVKTENVYGYATSGKFIDIGIPKDYEKSKSFFKDAGQVH